MQETPERPFDPAGALDVTARSRLRRKKERGRHDLQTINSVLDEGLVCHVGFCEADTTFVVPMAYARVERSLYLHGAAANRTLGTALAPRTVCVTVTIVDGLVLSRSAFHHSMNYRSVMIFGEAEPVTDPSRKQAALLAIVDHAVPGRSADTRLPSRTELLSTAVLHVPITEASAKVRSGGPIEEPEDLGLGFWAGEVPIELEAKRPVPDALLREGVEVPSYVSKLEGSLRRARAG